MLLPVRGDCVFLSDDGLCTIHLQFGEEAKPASCRQYPVVAAVAEGEVRVGVDPGCYTAMHTWRTGPEVGAGPWLPQRSGAWEGQGHEEAAVLAALQTAETTAEAIRALLDAGRGTGLPPGFAGRLLVRVQLADLGPALAQEDNGTALRAVLGPVLAHVETLRPLTPPPWRGLGPEAEAWVVEVTRRMVWLRLVDVPSASVVALLVLCGAVLAGWVDPGAGFGPRLAAWVRVLRSAAFRERLLPDPEALLHLAGRP